MNVRISAALAAVSLLLAGSALAQQGSNPTPQSGGIPPSYPQTYPGEDTGAGSGASEGATGQSLPYRTPEERRRAKGTDDKGVVQPPAAERRTQDAIKPSAE